MPLVRLIGALVLVGVLGVLTPAAYADPPDPTWPGGYWDDDDFDTAVDFIASVSATSAPLVIETAPAPPSTVRVEPRDPVVHSLALQALGCPRAPPASLASAR